MADSRPVTSELSRDLNLFHITMMGLGMMIGAGVFVGIGITVPKVGTGGLLLTFALNGMIALFTAMSFAELSSAIPRAGGAYNFARIGFGRGASFIAGWMEWFASSLAGAFYAVVFAKATAPFVLRLLGLAPGQTATALIVRATALAAAGLFIYINYRGSSETGKVGAIFTIAQMLFVLSIGVGGLAVTLFQPQRLGNFDPFLHQPGGWWRLLGTMGVIYVAFEGFEVIAQAGDETIDPKRNVPKAMLYSVAIVTVTYVLVALGSVVAFRDPNGALEWFSAHRHAPIDGFTGSVEQLIPRFGGLLVRLAIIASSTSALNATIYSATRASFALGRDGMLPGVFARISHRRRTPYVALLGTGAIVLIAASGLNEHHGAATASIMFLFLFLLVSLCVIRIRRNMGDELEYGYVMPLFPLTPVLTIVCLGGLGWGIMTESRVAWIIGPGWVLGGALVYLLYSRSHARAAEHEVHVFEEQRAPEPGGYRIMVSVANPDNALELVRNTYKLCGAVEEPHVELLHMVPVPDQVPLTDAAEYMLEGREGILETMLYLGPMYPISTCLRYCRSVARGIVSAVREKHVDLLILGWHGRTRGGSFRLGSTVDPIIERSPCNVVVFKECGGNRKFRKVLVPLAGGPNGGKAFEIASILADEEEGEITALTIETPRRSFGVEEFVEDNASRLRLPRNRVHAVRRKARNVIHAILEEAQEYDLVVLGCTEQPLLAKMVTRDSVPETIARRCDKPLVMVRAAGGIRSWVRRWI